MARAWRIILSGVAALGLTATAIPLGAQSRAMDFGDDSSDFANDGECDDLRFRGEGRAEVVLTDNIGRDASDCAAAFSAGTVSPDPMFIEPASGADILYGDDASEYAYDGACDDVRFVHADSTETIYLSEDVGHDATDCRAGVNAGTLIWQGHRADLVRGITAAQIMEAGGGVQPPTT